ncbi:MAG: hypothetical protein EXQ55_00180 [Acidobacteria bacterium]|nr:hypothetical protein [Acidobacteriota bacterium]
MTHTPECEYEALRATIRERGTMRICAVLGGLAAWGALAVALLITELQGAITLVPFMALVATFELNFFVHTGVERIGRYIQVFYEEAAGAIGWETTAMNYGHKFRGGPDPLFGVIFAVSAALNFLSSLATATRRPGWIALSLIAHFIFAYRIVAARKSAAAQRALDLDRFRGLISK